MSLAHYAPCSRISIFCMGYLVACFYFLLVGGDLLLKPVRSILLYWDCLIGYNVFVITMKNVLSVGCLTIIISCIYLHIWHILVVKKWNCLSFCLSPHVSLLVLLRVQILACGFIKSLVVNHCWLIQLFSLACTIKGYTKRIESACLNMSIYPAACLLLMYCCLHTYHSM